MPTAWLFDVDGVITNPEQKRVTEPQIINEMVKRLEVDQPVALVTGRSLDFMKERIIVLLKKSIKERKFLQNFLAVGEKGGVWISFTKDGTEQEETDKNISVPKDLQQEVKSLIEKGFCDTMFFDNTKRTMISTEMIDSSNLQNYHKKQEVLNRNLEELIKKHQLSESLEVDPTTIASDIQNKHVGKDFAAKRVLLWIEKSGFKPTVFITFGDSKSDIPMAQEVFDQNKKVKMVFVGKEQDRNDIKNLNLPFPVIFPTASYEKGTLEYLTTIA